MMFDLKNIVKVKRYTLQKMKIFNCQLSIFNCQFSI